MGELSRITGLSEQERNDLMDRIIEYQQILIDEVEELPEEAFPNLLQIIRLFKESILLQSRQADLALQAELAQWDRLSDEALVEFEKGLQ
jgi:hypothetical protein